MKKLAIAIALRFVVLVFLLLIFVYIINAQELESNKFPNDYRGIIHLHSELSRDSDGKFEDIIKAAQNNEVDFVVITDHWSKNLFEQSRSGLFGTTLIIAGAEIEKREGVSMITFPLPKDFVPSESWQKDVEILRKSGSIVLAEHIEFSETHQLMGFDGIEVINLHAHILQQNKFGLASTYFQALLPWNWNLAYIFTEIPGLKRWYYLNQEKPMPAFGGNDTHDNYRLFYLAGPKLGSYDNTFKLITTHIWADELSEKYVKEAVKKGQSYFAFEVFGNSKGFKFYASLQQVQGKQSDTEVFFPGNPIPRGLENKKITIAVQAPPHKDPSKTKIKILREGKVIKEGFGILLNLENPKPGNYYAEIWRDEKPWIFSNPIEIRPD